MRRPPRRSPRQVVPQAQRHPRSMQRKETRKCERVPTTGRGDTGEPRQRAARRGPPAPPSRATCGRLTTAERDDSRDPSAEHERHVRQTTESGRSPDTANSGTLHHISGLVVCPPRYVHVSTDGPLWADMVQRRVCFAEAPPDSRRPTVAYRQSKGILSVRLFGCVAPAQTKLVGMVFATCTWWSHSGAPVLHHAIPLHTALRSTIPSSQLVQNCFKSASAGSTGSPTFFFFFPIWNSFATAGARDCSENG